MPNIKLPEVRNVGKNCPYCQTPIKPGVSVIVCPNCQMPHHRECWTENSGCTTYGCKSKSIKVDSETVQYVEIGERKKKNSSLIIISCAVMLCLIIAFVILSKYPKQTRSLSLEKATIENMIELGKYNPLPSALEKVFIGNITYKFPESVQYQIISSITEELRMELKGLIYTNYTGYANNTVYQIWSRFTEEGNKYVYGDSTKVQESGTKFFGSFYEYPVHITRDGYQCKVVLEYLYYRDIEKIAFTDMNNATVVTRYSPSITPFGRLFLGEENSNFSPSPDPSMVRFSFSFRDDNWEIDDVQ